MAHKHNDHSDNEDDPPRKPLPPSHGVPTKLSMKKRSGSLAISNPKRPRTAANCSQQGDIENSPPSCATNPAPAAQAESLAMVANCLAATVDMSIPQEAALDDSVPAQQVDMSIRQGAALYDSVADNYEFSCSSTRRRTAWSPLDSINEMKERVDFLDESYERLEDDVRALQKSDENLEEDVRGLQESNGRLQEDVRDLQDSNERLEDDVRALQRSDENLEDDVRALQESNERLEEAVYHLQRRRCRCRHAQESERK